MLRLKIDKLLEEQGHSKYWLYKKMAPMSYQNLNKLYLNQTTSIHYSTLEKLKNALNVPIDSLFEVVEDKQEK